MKLAITTDDGELLEVVQVAADSLNATAAAKIVLPLNGETNERHLSRAVVELVTRWFDSEEEVDL